MRIKLSDLSKKQLKAIDDIQEIMDELKTKPLAMTSQITEEEKKLIADLIVEAAAKAYDKGYDAAKEE